MGLADGRPILQSRGASLHPSRRLEIRHLPVGKNKLILFDRLGLQFRRHPPQPACDREIERGARHRDENFRLPTQICTSDH
jgi:hypothetical protein